MKKAVTENIVNDEVIATLEGHDYWEWRTTIEEIKHAETKTELIQLKQKLMETEIRCAQFQSQLFKQQVYAVIGQQETLKKEYAEHVKKLEEKYNIVLKDCIIGDINYEVRRSS